MEPNSNTDSCYDDQMIILTILQKVTEFNDLNGLLQPFLAYLSNEPQPRPTPQWCKPLIQTLPYNYENEIFKANSIFKQLHRFLTLYNDCIRTIKPESITTQVGTSDLSKMSYTLYGI